MNQITKNAHISKLILGHVNDGMTVQGAVDRVLGEGTFQRLAGEVYDAHRGK